MNPCRKEKMKKNKEKKQNEKSAKTFFDESMGIEYFVNPETNKRPFPRDKYIYDDERFNSEQDMIYLNKLGRTIEITSCSFILLALLGCTGVLVWAKFL